MYFFLRHQPDTFDSTKKTKKLMILQTCKCSVSPRSLIETYVYCTFLYRLLTTKNGFHQRVTWVAQHFSTWLSWPDERNSGEVLSHRHPWGWGIAPEFASVLNRHVEDVFFFFFFRNEICHDIQLAMMSCFFKETNLQSVRSWRCRLFVKVTVQKETVQAMFNSMDTDHDDVIAYSEFLAAAMQAISRGEVRK